MEPDTNRKPIHELYAKGELTYKVNDRLSLSADGSFYQKWNYRPHGAFKYYTYDQFYRNFDVAGGAKIHIGED